MGGDGFPIGEASSAQADPVQSVFCRTELLSLPTCTPTLLPY